MEYKHFSDFADKTHLPLEGRKTKIDNILDKEIFILGFKLTTSKYMRGTGSPKCLTLQFEIDGKKHVLFTGSMVLIEQISTYQTELPFIATIKQIDRYYSFF